MNQGYLLPVDDCKHEFEHITESFDQPDHFARAILKKTRTTIYCKKCGGVSYSHTPGVDDL